MKKVKKLISALVCMAMLCAVLPAMTVGAGDIIYSGVCGDSLVWSIDGNGVLTISGTGDMWDFQSQPEGLLQAQIESCNQKTPPWYKWDVGTLSIKYIHKISRVVVKEGVTSIGSGAFVKCEASDYELADTINDIGESAFSQCEMYRIKLPRELTHIGSNAFYRCNYLNNVIIPDKTVVIDTAAFFGCQSLENVILGKNTEAVGYNAFAECYSLTNVWVGTSMKTIYNSAFSRSSVSGRKGLLNIFYMGQNWNNVNSSVNEELEKQTTKIYCNVSEQSPFEAKYARVISKDLYEIVGDFCGCEVVLTDYMVAENLVYAGYDMDVDFAGRKTILTSPDYFPSIQESKPIMKVGDCAKIYPSDWKIVINGREEGWTYNIGGYTLIKSRMAQWI